LHGPDGVVVVGLGVVDVVVVVVVVTELPETNPGDTNPCMLDTLCLLCLECGLLDLLPLLFDGLFLYLLFAGVDCMPPL